jgi:hypothetical protein
VQKLWQEFQHDYSRRLELAILDEDAAQQLQQIAKDLAEMRALLLEN